MDNEERNSYVKNEITKALLELLKENLTLDKCW